MAIKTRVVALEALRQLAKRGPGLDFVDFGPGDEEAIEALAKSLQDWHAEIRAKALDSLCQAGRSHHAVCPIS